MQNCQKVTLPKLFLVGVTRIISLIPVGRPNNTWCTYFKCLFREFGTKNILEQGINSNQIIFFFFFENKRSNITYILLLKTKVSYLPNWLAKPIFARIAVLNCKIFSIKFARSITGATYECVPVSHFFFPFLSECGAPLCHQKPPVMETMRTDAVSGRENEPFSPLLTAAGFVIIVGVRDVLAVLAVIALVFTVDRGSLSLYWRLVG